MAMTWTPSQKEAIDTRGSSLLVSAAAGSGKTAVLTARLISRITAGECDISKLCIVTFTRAAAAELKERIQKALSEALELKPGDKYLSRQLLLLPGAHISTIHSFCFDVLRSGFQSLGLSSGVRIADEAEISLLKAEAMDETLDVFYSDKNRPDFDEFTDNFITDRDDRLAEKFISICDSLDNLPEGIDYLAKSSEAHKHSVERDFMVSPWGAAIKERLRSLFECCLIQYNAAVDYFKNDELFAAKYLPCFSEELEYLRGLLKLLDNGTYNEISAAIANFPKIRIGNVKEEFKTAESEAFCSTRTDFSAQRRKIIEDFFGYSENDIKKLTLRTSAVCETLYAVLLDYRERLNAQKRRRKIVDYSDLERMTVTLLYNRDGSPSDTANELKQRFDEIYIDEYQDVNALQDKIFSAFAHPDGRFMVGDVKQSIYRFRGAEPDIFAAYRDSFASGGIPHAKTIFLSDNFRCDNTVVDFANTVSGCLFTHNSGKVPYYPEDALICSKLPEGVSSPVTIALFDKSESDGDQNRAEAVYVASRVASLISAGVGAGDIALLFRSAKSSAGIFCDELKKIGIPARNNVSGDFFEIPEIQLVMCLLNVVDNPARDIYLAGALRSPVFGFTLGDLALIRQNSTNDKEPLFDSLKKFAETADDESLTAKCRVFLNELSNLRENARSAPVDRFIRYIYRRLNLVSAGGRANLIMLYEYARKFEGGSFKGLYNFILYINDILEKRKTIEAPPQDDKAQTSVNVMTVHQSKGLEFPYVFLCDAGRSFNRSDARANLLLGRGELGLAMKLRDDTGYARLDTPLRLACATEADRDSIDEEMRVLYVAMTRARRKLFITATVDTEKARYQAVSDAKFMSPYVLSRSPSYIRWILASLEFAPPPDGTFELTVNPQSNNQNNVDTTANLTQTDIQSSNKTAESNESLEATLLNRFSFVYPHEQLTKVPAKLSVSRLAPDILDMLPSDSAELESEHEVSLAVPAFMLGEKKPSSSERGTATHIFMQFCNFDSVEKSGVLEELARLEHDGFIDAHTAKLVYPELLERFFDSDLYSEMKASTKLWRETRFNIKLPAASFTVDPELKKSLCDEMTLVQGVIDCFFESGGTLTLVDYKTDYLTNEERNDRRLAAEKLLVRHSLQLSYYRAALEKISGKKVSRTVIYSFWLGGTIEVPLQ